MGNIISVPIQLGEYPNLVEMHTEPDQPEPPPELEESPRPPPDIVNLDIVFDKIQLDIQPIREYLNKYAKNSTLVQFQKFILSIDERVIFKICRWSEYPYILNNSKTLYKSYALKHKIIECEYKQILSLISIASYKLNDEYKNFSLEKLMQEIDEELLNWRFV